MATWGGGVILSITEEKKKGCFEVGIVSQCVGATIFLFSLFTLHRQLDKTLVCNTDLLEKVLLWTLVPQMLLFPLFLCLDKFYTTHRNSYASPNFMYTQTITWAHTIITPQQMEVAPQCTQNYLRICISIYLSLTSSPVLTKANILTQPTP